MRIRWMPVVVVLAAACGLYLSAYTVGESEYVIVTRFGRPVRIIERSAARPHFKMPGLIDRVNRIDKRTQCFRTIPIQLLLGDKNPIIVSCYVTWRVADPLRFFQSLMTPENAGQKLSDMVSSQLGNVLGGYTLDNVINTDEQAVKLSEMEGRMTAGCNAMARPEYGIEVVGIGFRRVNYPSIVAEAVYNRMKAERDKEAKKYRAEGAEQASRIEAETDREASEIVARAYQEAETIKGEGDGEAMRIYAEAYGRDRSFFEFLKSMEACERVLGEKSTLILSTDSDLFRYLRAPEPAR
ncbi:MAG: protease modulator HflC [bacterium]|nr:protease modulator HflC [bacterium]